jgi:hypothetical protein
VTNRTCMSIAMVLVITNVLAADVQQALVAKPLTEQEARNALIYFFNHPTPYLSIRQCIERASVVGKGFDMETTVLRSCRLALKPTDFPRLIAESFPQLILRPLPVGHAPVCPLSEAFSPSAVYTSSESMDTWDYNDTVVYANSARSELLACHKVRIVP